MGLTHLGLAEFRIFASASFDPDPSGTTVLVGPNGTGKTSVLEAVAYLGTGRSFRGAGRDAMIRQGANQAILRAQLDLDGRAVQIEAELNRVGRSRIQVNRQAVRSRRDLAEAVAVTTFSPEDLGVVRGGPAGRRELLDDALSLLNPTVGPLLEELDRVLRQRAALLRQVHGRLDPAAEATLDIWDERLSRAGQQLIELRHQLALDLSPVAATSYAALAGMDRGPQAVTLTYLDTAPGSLADALAAARSEDLRRAMTTVGPHRDDLAVAINGRDARTQASQGEQRCLALALRLAVHRFVTEHLGVAPILLLDDVFSELDPDRSRRLVAELPPGQTLITSAVPLPSNVVATAVVPISEIPDVPAA